MRFLRACIAAFALTAIATPLPATTYYVSSAGSDQADGRSPATAWQSLDRVNEAAIAPGDQVLFRRGDTWRGQLFPTSGEADRPVTYGAYGEGPKPLWLGSMDKSQPRDWRKESDRVWVTEEPNLDEAPALSPPVALGKWTLHREGGAQARLDTSHSAGVLRVEISTGGTNSSHVQLVAAPFTVTRGKVYRLRFDARANRAIVLPLPVIHKNGPPWEAYVASRIGPRPITTEWRTYTAVCRSRATAHDARMTLYLGDPAFAGVTLELRNIELVESRSVPSINADVGNLIFGAETGCGVKRWTEADLKNDGDYWYEPGRCRVKLVASRNPAEQFGRIECALTKHIVSQTNARYVIYENLAMKYGAAHGIGGANTHHIIARNCDFTYIGGGDQYADGKRRVRFGNGIEFWAGAHDNLVEGCFFDQIYDAALTNQNTGSICTQRDIIYRNNLIRNSEYSFEYWNRPAESTTRNIVFENNTCIGAGRGWGHDQRADPSGRHLCLYDSPAAADGIIIRNNIFYDATKNAFYAPTWPRAALAALQADGNCWYQPAGTMISFRHAKYGMDQFAAYQQAEKTEAHSVAADPKFVNTAASDYRLRPDSPCPKAGQQPPAAPTK